MTGGATVNQISIDPTTGFPVSNDLYVLCMSESSGKLIALLSVTDGINVKLNGNLGLPGMF